MPKFINRIGEQYNRLIIVEHAGKNKFGQHQWKCQCNCGNTIITVAQHLRQGNTKSCGCLWREQVKRGENSPLWKGGRSVRQTGYVYVYTGPRGSQRSQLEHIAIMERHLGRKPFPNERVHHKNGLRSDNRIENLELWSAAHPAGQRVEDKIAWCLEFLSQYGVTLKVSPAPLASPTLDDESVGQGSGSSVPRVS